MVIIWKFFYFFIIFINCLMIKNMSGSEQVGNPLQVDGELASFDECFSVLECEDAVDGDCKSSRCSSRGTGQGDPLSKVKTVAFCDTNLAETEADFEMRLLQKREDSSSGLIIVTVALYENLSKERLSRGFLKEPVMAVAPKKALGKDRVWNNNQVAKKRKKEFRQRSRREQLEVEYGRRLRRGIRVEAESEDDTCCTML